MMGLPIEEGTWNQRTVTVGVRGGLMACARYGNRVEIRDVTATEGSAPSG